MRRLAWPSGLRFYTATRARWPVEGTAGPRRLCCVVPRARPAEAAGPPQPSSRQATGPASIVAGGSHLVSLCGSGRGRLLTLLHQRHLLTTLATALAMLVALALSPAAAVAQDASIDGTVVDAPGLRLRGVTVEARNQASGDVTTSEASPQTDKHVGLGIC